MEIKPRDQLKVTKVKEVKSQDGKTTQLCRSVRDKGHLTGGLLVSGDPKYQICCNTSVQGEGKY